MSNHFCSSFYLSMYPQIKIPCRWSISCWMTSAVNPVKVFVFLRKRESMNLTSILSYLLQGRRPSRDRQPSSASYVAGEVFTISGLYMTTDLFP